MDWDLSPVIMHVELPLPKQTEWQNREPLGPLLENKIDYHINTLYHKKYRRNNELKVAATMLSLIHI